MNNRIKELLKESTESRWYCGQEHDEVDQEKFAELIVKDCVNVCNERARSAPMGSDEQCEAEDCASAIMKKFGVEL